MENTKGELHIEMYRGLYAIYLNNTKDYPGKKCICKMVFKEYAEHFVKCWNEYHRLKQQRDDLLDAGQKFVNGWMHFLSCFDFGKSFLDADAIRFMNEVPGEIEQAVKNALKRKKVENEKTKN